MWLFVFAVFGTIYMSGDAADEFQKHHYAVGSMSAGVSLWLAVFSIIIYLRKEKD